uniref:Uncharacterized protein n=1 Tax=Setaria italica TaxID=4555 RepID=K3ZP80_SETIT
MPLSADFSIGSTLAFFSSSVSWLDIPWIRPTMARMAWVASPSFFTAAASSGEQGPGQLHSQGAFSYKSKMTSGTR